MKKTVYFLVRSSRFQRTPRRVRFVGTDAEICAMLMRYVRNGLYATIEP